MRFSIITFAFSALVGTLVTLVEAAPVNAADAGIHGLFKRQGRAVITTCTTPNTVAITFDDGPYKYTRDVVDTLGKYGTKATFFVNGGNWDCIYNKDNVANIKYAHERGHQFASHTWSHKNLTTLSRGELEDEMERVDVALARIIGAKPAFLRPPYGSYNDLVLEVAANRGQQVVNWDFDNGDTVGASPEESKRRYDELVQKHPSTVIALNHEVKHDTVYDVLPHALEVLSKSGYEFKTVAECLGQPAYKSYNTPEPGPFSC